jgi:hypothetical protein
MMGEYILYYRGKVFGGIYDDRFMVTDTKILICMLAYIKALCNEFQRMKNENIYYDWRLGGLCSSGRFFALDG